MHVSEGILVGYEVNKALFAVRIELKDIFASKWRSFRPNIRMAAISEGVFGIELELINFPRR